MTFDLEWMTLINHSIIVRVHNIEVDRDTIVDLRVLCSRPNDCIILWLLNVQYNIKRQRNLYYVVVLFVDLWGK